MPISFPIAPSASRYIKLGVNNGWFKSCLDNDRLEFGHHDVSHDIGVRADREAIVKVYTAMGRTTSKASDYAREVLDFFQQPADCLWITFADGCLWWAFAKPDVIHLGETASNGERCRPLEAPWSNRNANGDVLTIGGLSTKLTKVAAYRQTICRVEAADYLVRRINAVEEPEVAQAVSARAAVLAAAEALIASLHWRDFEVLCDLIFARSGWQRTAELGELQKDTDLVLEQTVTGERGFVQIKSAADAATLRGYVEDFSANPGFQRMFFVCHSPRGNLIAQPAAKPVHVWTGSEIARQAVAAGLFDWLMKKAGWVPGGSMTRLSTGS